MSNKFYEITVDSNSSILFLSIIGIVILLSIAAYYFFKSGVFLPGQQYMHTLKKLNSKKVKKKVKTTRIADEERQRQTALDFEIKLQRLRWNMNAQEFHQKVRMETYIGLILGLAIVGVGVLLEDIGNWQILIVLVGLLTMVGGAMKTRYQFNKEFKRLQTDTIKDITRLVSLYKFSDTSRGFYGLVQDYMGTANALKKDLEFYMSDLNTYGEEHALDRLGERIQLPQIFKLITYIKSSQTATKAQFEANLHMLDRELTEELKEINRKESNARFRTTMITIVPILGAAMFIVMATQIFDIYSLVGGGL